MISQTSDKLQSLEFVTDAGAAPTDVGQIPCFQVKLTHGAEMNDTNQREVERIVEEGMGSEFDGELVVQSSKEVIDEGLDTEIYCFWVFVYGSLDQINVGGMDYHVVEWSESGGVTAVPTGHTDPISGIDRFKWSEISWRPDGF